MQGERDDPSEGPRPEGEDENEREHELRHASQGIEQAAREEMPRPTARKVGRRIEAQKERQRAARDGADDRHQNRVGEHLEPEIKAPEPLAEIVPKRLRPQSWQRPRDIGSDVRKPCCEPGEIDLTNDG